MQKKLAFLVYATTSLLALDQAIAVRHYYPGEEEKFAITSSDGKYKMGFSGTLVENNALVGTKTGDKTDFRFKLELKKARIALYGHAFRPYLSYFFQVGYEKPQPYEKNAEIGSNLLKDYYVDLAFEKRYAHLRIGKFLTPLSRQQLMLNIWDKDLASRAYNDVTPFGRDVGLMIHNHRYHWLEYAVAVVSHGVVARLGYNHGEVDGYDPSDWRGGGLRFGVAANGFIGTDYASAKLEDVQAAADFIIKYAHFATNGGFYWKLKRAENQDGKHTLGAGVDLSYLLNGNIEPVLRYSWLRSPGGPNQSEILAGANYYLHGHNLKLQGYGGVNLQGKEMPQWQLGVQVQFAI